MNLSDVIKYLELGGGALFVLMTLVQITPIKFNPWTWLARSLGKAINGGDVMGILQTHITDVHRYRILRFNADLLKGDEQSKEEFDEILYSIDCYEKYCQTHPEYKNNRCMLAIANIEREYKAAMQGRRFLEYSGRYTGGDEK